MAAARRHARPALACSIALLLAMTGGCSRTQPKAQGLVLKKLPAGAQNAGFLSTYAALKPNPSLENALTYVKGGGAAQAIRQYFAVIVDPVELYVATNADV